MSLVRRVVSVNRWVPRRRGAINKKTTRVSQVKWTMAPTAAAKPDLVRSVTTDAASLQAYLSRNTHKRVFLLSSEDFTLWCERETSARLQRDPVAAIHARGDATRRFHLKTLGRLETAAIAADAAFRDCDDAPAIHAAEKTLAHAKAAIEGMRSFLEVMETLEKSCHDVSRHETGELRSKSRADDDATKKAEATRLKLVALVTNLPGLERSLRSLLVSSKTWHAKELAKEALRNARQELGLESLERAAKEASKKSGRELTSKGSSFEAFGARIVGNLIREGGLSGFVQTRNPEPTNPKPPNLLLLRNVHLGMAFGELDLVLVSVDDVEEAFVGGDETISQKDKKRKKNAVTVLAVFECKRNPDDCASGYVKRVGDLHWLSGGATTRVYDREQYVNKNYPSGHFTVGYHPCSRIIRPVFPNEVDERIVARLANPSASSIVLTPESFRLFDDKQTDTHPPRRLWLVTRPRTMCGLDTKVRFGMVIDALLFFSNCFFFFSRTHKNG